MGIVAIDCFCGAGGTTRGFIDAGIDVAKGVDADPLCARTYEENNPGASFAEMDIRKATAATLMEGVHLRESDDLLLAGCAPCQPFSKRTRDGGKPKERTLLGHFGRLVRALEPRFVFVENVPGLQKVSGNSTFSRFLRMLKDEGYGYRYAVLDAAGFGVPQHRLRLVLIAARGQQIALPDATHGDAPRRPFVTVRQAIADLPPLRAGGLHAEIPNHQSMALSEKNLERMRATPKDGGDRRAWPERLQLECHKQIKGGGHTDVYGRMRWDRPAPTLTCRCASLSNGRYGHPTQNRAISAREAAALQTFDSDFVFHGMLGTVTRHIGNAVPVRFAAAFGRHFQRIARASATRRGT